MPNILVTIPKQIKFTIQRKFYVYISCTLLIENYYNQTLTRVKTVFQLAYKVYLESFLPAVLGGGVEEGCGRTKGCVDDAYIAYQPTSIKPFIIPP